jgi:hypothetical protein
MIFVIVGNGAFRGFFRPACPELLSSNNVKIINRHNVTPNLRLHYITDNQKCQ